MNILLIQVDGKMPNLALMKLSASHKHLGNSIFFNKNCDPKEVYISCIFTQNRSKALGIARMFPQAEIHLGGSGINYSSVLPDEVEHIMPDYSLYGIDYSMGFTSRGCIRNCGFCIVPKKEGMIRNNATLREFLHPDHKKVILFDNNFLASPRWRENLLEIADCGLKVSFNQGLDIRLINQENAKLLSKAKYYDWKFKNRCLYFAFDSPEIEDNVLKGIKILNQAGIPSKHLMFYMLVGYDTEFSEDLHRFEVLNKLGVMPFIMVFNNRKDKPILRHFARWVNQLFYQFIPFEKYDHGNSQEIIKRYAMRGYN